MGRSSFASVLMCASVMVACGAAPAVLAPDIRATVPPRASVDPPPPPRPATRPAQTALWVHFEDPASLVLMLAALKVDAKSAGVPTDEIATYLATIDLGRPIDAALSFDKELERGKVVDAAVHLSFRDSKAFLKLLATQFSLREEGDRIHIGKKGADSDPDAKPDEANANDVLVCEFDAPAQTSDTAVCGSAHGVAVFRDWLRTSPRLTTPSKTPISRPRVFRSPLLSPRTSGAREVSSASRSKARPRHS